MNSLFSETRPPNFLHGFPQHTITLARSTSADRIYLRTEESRKATEQAIRNGTLTFVEVGEDIPAIETIEHATGWPFSQGAHSRLIFQSLAEMASADIQIQLYGGNLYETPVLDDGVTVLSSGPMKTAKSVLFDQKPQPELWPPHTVFVHSSRPHSLYHILLVFLKDAKSAQRLCARFAEKGNTVLSPNDVVKGVLLIPRPGEPSGNLFAYGLETMPEKAVSTLKELTVQKLASGVWTKRGFSTDDEHRLLTNLGPAESSMGYLGRSEHDDVNS